MWRRLYELPSKVKKVVKKILPIKEKITEVQIMSSNEVKIIPSKSISKINKNAPKVQKTTKKDTFKEDLFSFVSKWEWSFQPKAFCDSYYKTTTWLVRKIWKDCTRWSIWYWTESYWGEIISYEEWVRRRDADILNRNNLITSSCLTNNQRIVTVDFMYQHWNSSSKVKVNANLCNPNAIFWMITWWRDRYNGKIAINWKYIYQPWMVKREQLRINLFYKKDLQ